MNVGIDAFSFDLPKIYLPIPVLANHRNIEPEKLTKGLGLQRMSFPDVHQDAVTFAANAVLRLINQNQLNPKEISRIYVGTESAVDASKPIGTYIIQLLEQVVGTQNFNHCDVVDMTFACIGAVDALHICLDFIRLNPSKKAIVVATDTAKYDLNSTGEYTQGAGAIAMLVTANPRIANVSQTVGISTEGVFDFFKPRRYINKENITQNPENIDWNGVLETEIAIYKDQPVFDGQYSNTCYVNRVKEAYQHFKNEQNTPTENISKNWQNVLMHLPYCYQGRRMFVELFALENPEILAQQEGETAAEKLKKLAKSPEYTAFVNQKIYPSEIASGAVGNIYTGSLFLGLLSTLCYHYKENSNLTNVKMGCIAYGSGSKSKVFELEINQNWQTAIAPVQLFETLEKATEISFETYEKLHKKEQKTSVIAPTNEFYLSKIETENPALVGARYYEFKS